MRSYHAVHWVTIGSARPVTAQLALLTLLAKLAKLADLAKLVRLPPVVHLLALGAAERLGRSNTGA